MIIVDRGAGLKGILRHDKLCSCTPDHRVMRLTLSETAEFLYKTTDFYAPEYERSLLWNDPALGIDWPFDAEPILSAKDQAAATLSQAELYR
jgi:hypothetical protein